MRHLDPNLQKTATLGPLAHYNPGAVEDDGYDFRHYQGLVEYPAGPGQYREGYLDADDLLPGTIGRIVLEGHGRMAAASMASRIPLAGVVKRTRQAQQARAQSETYMNPVLPPLPPRQRRHAPAGHRARHA